MYWVYQTAVYTWQDEYIQAKLIAPQPRTMLQLYGSQGYRSPRQHDPYGIKLTFTYQINPKHSHPDNYLESAGFSLYSERLVALMKSFEVKAEVFPVSMVDKPGHPQPQLNYYVFHSLEGVLDAMDEEQSGWTRDHDISIPRLILDYSKFEHRPIFICQHVYVQLMRDDLKQAIHNRGITGFRFLKPERYKSGKYGFAPDFDD